MNNKFLFLLSMFVLLVCGNTIGNTLTFEDDLLESPVKQTKPISFYKKLLEEFCKVHYHEMFEGRSYVYTSIHIEECNDSNSGVVDIRGTHSYKGRFGKRYDGYGFKANIREMATEPDTYYIVFEKEGIKPITLRKYWESSSKRFVYKE